MAARLWSAWVLSAVPSAYMPASASIANTVIPMTIARLRVSFLLAMTIACRVLYLITPPLGTRVTAPIAAVVTAPVEVVFFLFVIVFAVLWFTI